MQRPERRRHRRRRRRESSSSYDSESEPRKKRRRKMRCKTQEVAEEEAPDFENMSYADYVEWWRKSHAAPGGPEGGTHAEFSSPPVAPEAPPASEAQMSAMPQSGRTGAPSTKNANTCRPNSSWKHSLAALVVWLALLQLRAFRMQVSGTIRNLLCHVAREQPATPD